LVLSRIYFSIEPHVSCYQGLFYHHVGPLTGKTLSLSEVDSSPTFINLCKI